jgi:hypothetical protein
LGQLRFQFAQRIAELPHRLAAHRAGRDAPGFEGFLRPLDGLLIVGITSRAHTPQPPAIDRRELFDDRPTANPFTAKGAGIFVGEAEFFE